MLSTTEREPQAFCLRQTIDLEWITSRIFAVRPAVACRRVEGRPLPKFPSRVHVLYVLLSYAWGVVACFELRGRPPGDNCGMRIRAGPSTLLRIEIHGMLSVGRKLYEAPNVPWYVVITRAAGLRGMRYYVVDGVSGE